MVPASIGVESYGVIISRLGLLGINVSCGVFPRHHIGGADVDIGITGVRDLHVFLCAAVKILVDSDVHLSRIKGINDGVSAGSEVCQRAAHHCAEDQHQRDQCCKGLSGAAALFHMLILLIMFTLIHNGCPLS